MTEKKGNTEMTKVELGRDSYGREFPTYNGELLSWSLGLHHTYNEEQAGFPRMRAVIQAMLAHRPAELARERRELVKGSFDRIFGHIARKGLAVLDEETGNVGATYNDAVRPMEVK